jgi:hypothetical protein
MKVNIVPAQSVPESFSSHGKRQPLSRFNPDWPIEPTPQVGAFYRIYTKDTLEALFVPEPGVGPGTRLALQPVDHGARSHWELVDTSGGELFVRCEKKYPWFNNTAELGNADVLQAQFDVDTNVCIAIQAVGQTWTLEGTGKGDGSFYIKSLLGIHLNAGDARKKYKGDLYMGYTPLTMDVNNGVLRWVTLKPRNQAAQWWFSRAPHTLDDPCQ